MKQFGKILKFELKYYFKNKVFIGVTAFLMLLIAVVMFFPRITALFEEENAPVDAPAYTTVDTPVDTSVDSSADFPVMLVKADAPAEADMVRGTFAAAFTYYDVQITDAEINAIKDKITSGEVECAFVMT